MTQNISKNKLLSCLLLLAPAIMFGQDAVTPTAPAQAGGGIDFNILLLIISVFLLLPIYITGKALLMVVNNYVNKDKQGNPLLKKLGTLALLLFSAHFIQAQGSTPNEANSFSWLLMTIIIVESIVIIFFSWLINNLLNTYKIPEIGVDGKPIEEISFWGRIWNRMNRFKPIEEEGSIDTGHSYDGIRELDNITPPWFITAFVLTIIFAIIYLYRYHVAQSAPLSAEEFRIEMADAEAAKAKMAANQANTVDENTITMLDASEIAQGKGLFTKNCTSCHGAAGGSMPGGVGPNLTDEYWIHGGSLQSIFKTIKNGWPEKGMIAWKNQLSPKQIAQLTCYIKSIKGSNPEGAKAPQGDLYVEETTVKKDSTAIDTTAKPVVKPTK